MARKVTIRQLVDKETEQQLRELVAQHNQQKSTQSQSQSQPSSNQSRNQNQPPQNNQKPEGFHHVVATIMPIINEGCGGLRGLAVRVYTPKNGSLAPAKLVDKRSVELQQGDLIIEANYVFAGQPVGNIRIYQVELVTGHLANVRWLMTLGPDGKILNQTPDAQQILGSFLQVLEIRARHALNAAMETAKRAATRLFVPTRRYQPRRQSPPRNPYLNWR
jgi:hypothetical protein